MIYKEGEHYYKKIYNINYFYMYFINDVCFSFVFQ
jgi:hypothetical protein